MKTENEILAMPLVERQKLWVELKQVATNDKDFAAARAVIELIEATDEWEKPEKLTAVATDNTIVDGKSVKKGETIEVYEWQFNALRRHLADPKVLEEKKAAKAKKTGGAAAALIAFILALFCQPAQAQVQSTIIGSPGGLWVQSVAGMYNGVILPMMTTNIISPVTNTLSITTNANWSNSSGIWTNQPTYVTNTQVSIPGLVVVAGYQSFTLSYSGQMMAGTTNVNSVCGVDYSTDAVNWQTNRWQLPITMAGTGQGTTNLDVTYPVTGGYIRFDNPNNPATVPETNTCLEISRKASINGP